MPSATAEDYLKTVYQLADGDEPVPTSAIADTLDVTPPTVTATMKRLESHGFVEREEYKGVRLTEDGSLIALETIRHHRLLELFLAEHLGYDWTEVHDEADTLEHHIANASKPNSRRCSATRPPTPTARRSRRRTWNTPPPTTTRSRSTRWVRAPS